MLTHTDTVKPPIKDTPKEDKLPNKGQAEHTIIYTLYRKSLLKEDNLSAKDKTAGPESVLIKRFHCIPILLYLEFSWFLILVFCSGTHCNKSIFHFLILFFVFLDGNEVTYMTMKISWITVEARDSV